MSPELAELCFLLAWGGGAIPMYVDASPAPRGHLRGTPMEMAARLQRDAHRLDHVHSRQLEIGLPEKPPPAYAGAATSTVLWAWVESLESVRWAAKRFRFPPTYVIRIGKSCRRLLLWGLEAPASVVAVEPANKRIAYALHAPQKYARPEVLRIPVPGTCLRQGRKRPALAVTTLREDRTYDIHAFERLKDPPPPYMERLRRGEVRGR